MRKLYLGLLCLTMALATGCTGSSMGEANVPENPRAAPTADEIDAATSERSGERDSGDRRVLN